MKVLTLQTLHQWWIGGWVHVIMKWAKIEESSNKNDKNNERVLPHQAYNICRLFMGNTLGCLFALSWVIFSPISKLIQPASYD